MRRRALILLALASPALAQFPSDRTDDVLAAQFSEYKFASPLRRAVEDWPGARTRAVSDPAMRDWVKGVRWRTTSWMTRYGDRGDWVAGWGHDLVDPASGTPLTWSWDMPEPAQGTDAERRLHGAWVAYRREANIRTVVDAARLWRLTGDTGMRDWAAAQIDLYAAAYGAWPLQRRNGLSRMMGQSLDEATNGIALAEAARLLTDSIPADRQARWNGWMFAPMLANLQASNQGANNIAVWQAAASAILALRLEQEADYRRAIMGPGGVDAMLARGITAEYLWFEPSPAYGAYTQSALATLFTAASLEGRDAPLRRAMLLTQAMVIGQATMRFADGTLPAIGDSTSGISAFDANLLALTQRTMPIRAISLPPSWATLLDPTMPGGGAPAETRSRSWPTSQAAMLRSGGWELFFHYGQTNASHAQGDALSWEVRRNGAIVTQPAGTAAYGSALFRDYLRTSTAHNMPLVDGRGQIRIGQGSLIALRADRIEASQPGFPRDAKVRRALSVDDAALVEDTVIALPGGATGRLGAVFNTDCGVVQPYSMAPATTPRGDGFSWWRQVRGTATVRQWTATLVCGDDRFALTLTGDAPGRVFLALAPDRMGRWARSAIYYEAPATSSLFLRMKIVPR